MRIYKLVLGLSSLIAFLGFSGCGDSASTTSTPATGSVSVELTDAPGDYSAVYVTIDEIRVHRAGDDTLFEDNNGTNSGWMVVASPHKTYDLLALQNGITAELGEANISTGKYTQMRLVLGNIEDNGTNILGNPHPYSQYVVFNDGSDIAPLDTPSNVIKQNHNFDVLADSKLVLTIDFDANKSITDTGSGKYILKPVLGLVSVKDTNGSDIPADDVNITI